MPTGLTTLSQALFLAFIVSLSVHDNALAQEYDSMTAEIPAAQAAIGSVALAKLNIVLCEARLQALETLCQGSWNPIGQAIQVIGPKPATDADGRPVWHYQSLRQAHPLACAGVSRARFFLETSRYLPAWVTIRPAGYTIAFRHGEIDSPTTSFAKGVLVTLDQIP